MSDPARPPQPEDRHRPLSMPANRDAQIQRAIEADDGHISVGGSRPPQLPLTDDEIREMQDKYLKAPVIIYDKYGRGLCALWVESGIITDIARLLAEVARLRARPTTGEG